MENRAQEQIRIAADIESKYSYLVTMNHRDRVVRTLNTTYINFDFTQKHTQSHY